MTMLRIGHQLNKQLITTNLQCSTTTLMVIHQQ